MCVLRFFLLERRGVMGVLCTLQQQSAFSMQGPACWDGMEPVMLCSATNGLVGIAGVCKRRWARVCVVKSTREVDTLSRNPHLPALLSSPDT